MPSNQPATTVARPLSMMKKLSPFVYYYEPSEAAVLPEPAHSGVPRLILMASWMDARELHIAKYITQYQAIFPSSAILLVKFATKELASTTVANRTVQPAVVYIQSRIESGFLSVSPMQPEILVHLFSNGGSTTMRILYENFLSQMGHTFPLHAAVYDSCPGLYAFLPSYNAFIIGFQKGFLRFIAAPFVTALIVCLWIWHRPLRMLSGEDFLARNSRIHNDPTLVKQTNRSYIYGKADIMVDWRHVETHIKQAAAKGFVTRQELFEHSPHVSHMRTNGERYWKIFMETWRKATG